MTSCSLIGAKKPTTVRQFVKLLRKTYDECNPCHYHYDAVIKMETFSEDVSNILESVGAGWIAPAHANNREGPISTLKSTFMS